MPEPAAGYALIPGAGGSGWYWHRVAPLLTAAGHHVVTVDLPADDDTAGLDEYADHVCGAVADLPRPLILAAQSMGAFTAPLVARRIPTAKILLVNPMIPAPGESAAQWWSATDQKPAMIEHLTRIGLGRNDFDGFEDFFHDTPEAVRAQALAEPEPEQSDTPFEQPWPLSGWPDVPTAVICGADDRLFPLEFARRIARERLGIEDIDVMPGGHLMALSRPDELAAWLLSHAG